MPDMQAQPQPRRAMGNFGIFKLLIPILIVCSTVMARPTELELKKGWLIQSGDRVTASGQIISREAFTAKGWYSASVPSTVLGSLVADGVFKHVFRGKNLDSVPDSIFVNPWWYRTSFRLPSKSTSGNHAILKFLGVNYSADIWLNGHLIAGRDSVLGGFRQFEFDITRFAVFGGINVLAVKVYRPGPGAVTLGFVDWNPRPPDHDMGLWRPVVVRLCGDVAISRPFVATKVDTATLKRAWLTVSAELANLTDHTVEGLLTGNIGSIVVSQSFRLSPGERISAAFSPDSFRQLVVRNPRLWWTHDFGKPNLYDLRLEFKANGKVTDTKSVKFGIRQVNQYTTPQGFKGYKLNGRRILIRGGGWTDDIFLTQDEDKLKAQIDYAVNMNLNALRLEGFWGEGDEIYSLCDAKGLLVMVGWSAQWEWDGVFGAKTDEFGGIMTQAQMRLAAASFRDEVTWLRNHPSIFVWLYGSDKTPRPELENMYQGILARYDTTRPYLASAAEHVSKITGPTGVKMRGPYDYVPPDYWYSDTSYGGAFGFNTETGPGPQVPVVESLRRMLSPDSLWPINGEWLFHCSRGEFGNLKRYNDAIDGRLGPPADLNDYERKAQYTNYEAMRAMYEAFGARKFTSTGVIQWMYNTAWPKMWWQLYDYYLNPTGAFYGAQEACRPIHALYDYASHSVFVVNSTLSSERRLKLEVRVFNSNLSERLRKTVQLASPANESIKAIDVPTPDSASSTYFLSLRLERGGKLVDENFYALSRKSDMLDWKKSTWYVTPDTSYADLTGLDNLPEVALSATSKFIRRKDHYSIAVTLRNPSDKLAFMVRLTVRKSTTGSSVLPVFWESNYITLLPGETRTIMGKFNTRSLGGEKPVVAVSGWNVKDKVIGR